MKWVIVLWALMVMATADDLYSTENDDFDIDSAVKDNETRIALLKCFNDKGDCDHRSADFKKDIPEAVAQACAKCTQAQKYIFKVFLDAIKEKDAEEYKVFQEKYDPLNKYLAALEANINA